MKRVQQLEPGTIEKHPNLVRMFPDPTYQGNTFYFVLDDDHLIVADSEYFTNKRTGKSKWIGYQIEFPKRGLRWFLTALEDKFFKTEAEGGLPKGVFNTEGCVDGERLKLRRAFNADSNNGGGYAFVTLDRFPEGRKVCKSYTFTDSLLFDHGLIDAMKDIAHKVDMGLI
ncbi:hypothetical protein [Vibrio nigripulchritudo]|uniref:hypothetical protein n=1 Tax=Vibrio nigripulchritudo TaxID=28173 RepID=UPI0007E4FDAB|nr:hypothetical protein [Vibrio nigripulchritudo]